MSKNKIGVGFGIIVINQENKILLGKRHDDPEKADSDLHGEGSWTMPGGKLDFGEKFKEGACREVLEETSLILNENNLKLISLTDDIVSDAHYVTAGFICKSFKGEVKIMEPDEIVKWSWFSLDSLPKPLYPASEKVLKNYLDKEIYKH